MVHHSQEVKPGLSMSFTCPCACPGCERGRGVTTKVAVEKNKFEKFSSILAGWKKDIKPLSTAEGPGLGYRTKICLKSYRNAESEAWRFGLISGKPKKETFQFYDIANCPLHSQFVREVLGFFSTAIDGKIPLAYLAVSGLLVTLVIKSKQEPQLNIDFEQLARIGVKGLFLNLNPSTGKRIFGSRAWRKIWGEEKDKQRILGNDFVFGPASFQQQIIPLYESALVVAQNFLLGPGGVAVVDLYSGVGASLWLWNKKGSETIGVELGSEAVGCAKANVPNATILQGKVSDRVPQLQEWVETQGARQIVAFVNPPRTGLEADVLSWLSRERKVEKIAYLSCSPGTFKRDLTALNAAGFCVHEIIPYDFFPYTKHIEALALLIRVRS